MCADGTCLKKPNPECDFLSDCPDASDEKQCGEQKMLDSHYSGTSTYEFTEVTS